MFKRMKAAELIAAAKLIALDPERYDAMLTAASKIEVLAEALVTHADHAEMYEDIAAVASIVSSVARRQQKLAGLIVQALDGSIDWTTDLGMEAHNG